LLALWKFKDVSTFHATWKVALSILCFEIRRWRIEQQDSSLDKHEEKGIDNPVSKINSSQDN
jgi:hypothetical protein